MKKSFFTLTRFSAATLVALFCISTLFYACGASKEEMARKKAIEKTERMTAPTPAKADQGSTLTPAKTPARRIPMSKKVEVKADTMR